MALKKRGFKMDEHYKPLNAVRQQVPLHFIKEKKSDASSRKSTGNNLDNYDSYQ
jgi:hypothetical protein